MAFLLSVELEPLSSGIAGTDRSCGSFFARSLS
jgi:hypothetical protein